MADPSGRSPGQRIGRYELAAQLGSGGMGEVWQAWLHGPRGFRKPVALKLLRASGGPRSEEALVREARLGALLNHPNVVATHELGHEDGIWFVAMELVQGPTVATLHQREPLSPSAILDIGQQVCAGLVQIHGFQIDGPPLVHRDIKPQNLLVDRTGSVKITDFGVAAFAGEGQVAGTAGYMAPEQATGRPEPRSDLFSLGCVLYLLATGQRPFGSGLPSITASSSVERLLADPAFLAPVARVVGLDEVVARCIRRDPEARWRDAQSLGNALRALRSANPGGPSLAERAAAATPGRPESSGGSATTVIAQRPQLPVPGDRFVGREDVLQELLALVRSGARLVTLTGLGGMGKTRLALEAARELRTTFAGGVTFHDLSEARTVESLCAATAAGLGVRLGASDPAARVGEAMAAAGRALFVLDNLEQVVGPAAETVAHWMEVAPDAVLLTTSRVPLRLRAEVRFPLAPLDADEARRLFVARAPLEVPVAHQDTLVALVRELDGIPLAIELAAARLRSLPVPELYRRLHDRLRLLAGGPRDAVARHRSLRASLDGSWELLSDLSRTACAQLAVFEGGFGDEAAEGVLVLGTGPRAPWALDALQELVDAGLLRVDADSGRFSFPVVVQAYANEQLGSEDRVATELRHARWFAGTRSPLGRVLDGGRDLDNLVVATARALQHRRADLAGYCALAAGRILALRGPVANADRLLAQVLEAWSARDELRVRLLQARAEALWLMGQAGTAKPLLAEALDVARERGERGQEGKLLMNLSAVGTGSASEDQRLLEEAARIHREVGDLGALATALYNLGVLHRDHEELAAAHRSFEEALALTALSGDRRQRGFILTTLGSMQHDAGALDDARRKVEEAVRGFRVVGDLRGEGIALMTLGNIEGSVGRIDVAIACYTSGLGHLRALGERAFEAILQSNLGGLYCEVGEYEEARTHLDAAIEGSRRVGNVAGGALALGNRAILERELGNLARAETDMVGALTTLREAKEWRRVGELLAESACLHQCVGDVTAARADLAEGERLLRRVGDPIELGRLLCRRVLLEASADPSVARAALAEAEALYEQIASLPMSALGRALTKARRSIEDAQAARRTPSPPR